MSRTKLPVAANVGKVGKVRKTILREGFWSHKGNRELPKPIERIGKEWNLKAEFLEKLAELEKQARAIHYKGWSDCRICKQHNGSVTYDLGGWQWPEGYKHYIDKHNVLPSLAFTEFVLGRELGE